MAVYVDDALIPAHVGRITSRWSHLQADTTEELHEFAAKLGLRRAWFQHDPRRPDHDHYDVTEGKRWQAIKLGAVSETWREGVRRRKRARQR